MGAGRRGERGHRSQREGAARDRRKGAPRIPAEDGEAPARRGCGGDFKRELALPKVERPIGNHVKAEGRDQRAGCAPVECGAANARAFPTTL